MLAAIRSLYSSGALSMRVGGTTGPPVLQQDGVRQGCSPSPALFGIFFDGLHSHLDSIAPHVGVQLGSGRWVSSLACTDDDVLLSWMSARLQSLLDSMNSFCQALGLSTPSAPPRQRLCVCVCLWVCVCVCGIWPVHNAHPEMCMYVRASYLKFIMERACSVQSLKFIQWPLGKEWANKCT